jgi:hypothetical protein
MDGMLFALKNNSSSVGCAAYYKLKPKRANSCDAQEHKPTARSSSGTALLSTLIPVVVVAVASVTTFLFLRRTERHLYAPRTILDTIDEE